MFRALIALFCLFLVTNVASATGVNVTGSIAGIAIDVLTDAAAQGTPGTPTVSSCGTSPTLSTGATDAGFTVTPGTGATGCTITLGGTYTNPVSGIPAAENNTAVTWSWSNTTFASFDPSNKGADMTLSGGNLTASVAVNVSDQYNIARSLTSHSSGKYYFECTMSSATAAADFAIGVANASAPLSSGDPGFDSNLSIAAYGTSTNFSLNSSNTATAVTTFAIGDVVGLAVDLGAQKIWQVVMHSGGVSSWNGSFSSSDVASGTGGQAISAITGPYYASCWGNADASVASVFTGNFGGSAYQIVTNSGTVPSGFGNW